MSLFDTLQASIKTSRNGFDLSNKNAFSAKAGEILPCYCKIMCADDIVEGSVQHFTRTIPVETAAYVRIKEHFDWFFVPMSQLWKSFPSVITQMTENVLQAKSFDSAVEINTEVPYLELSQLVGNGTDGVNSVLSCLKDSDLKNYFGFSRVHTSGKLLNYLGYGKTSDKYMNDLVNPDTDVPQREYAQNVPLNVFKLLAYQKIYCDYFRNSQWEKNQPWTFNVDYSSGGKLINQLPDGAEQYWTNPTMFDLRYANWEKDMFMGALPNQQFGSVAMVLSDFGAQKLEIPSQSVPQNATGNVKVQTSSGLVDAEVKVDTAGDPKQAYVYAGGASDMTDESALTAKLTGSLSIPAQSISLDKLYAQFSVIRLRQQEFLQRWKEVAQSADQDYKDQMKRQYNADISPVLSGLSMKISGSTSMIDINPVVSQNINVKDDQLANIAGVGVGSDQASIKFTAPDWGVLMCVYHCTPLLDYDTTGIDLENLRTDVMDFPQPAFDKIGMEELPFIALDNSYSFWQGSVLPLSPMGYVPRYISAKTSIDVVNGAFSNWYKNWVAPLSTDYLKNLLVQSGRNKYLFMDYNFFKVNPHILDTIFGVAAGDDTSTDQFLINSYFDIKKVTNLDVNGLPY